MNCADMLMHALSCSKSARRNAMNKVYVAYGHLLPPADHRLWLDKVHRDSHAKAYASATASLPAAPRCTCSARASRFKIECADVCPHLQIRCLCVAAFVRPVQRFVGCVGS